MLGTSILVALAVAVGAVAVLVTCRLLLQAFAKRGMVLRGSAAIDESGFVRIGGIDQWVSIRGADRSNPVLVVLHGGPGAGFQIIAGVAMRPWEENFTVVQWDQRGAGRTFGRNGAKGSGQLSIERMTDDAIELVQHALGRTGQAKAIVLGASWGSILGLQVARRRPDLLYAYVGAGQVVDMQANEAVGYEGLMARLEARGAVRAAARLAAIGPPPYANLKALLKQRRILFAHSPKSEQGLVRRVLFAALTAPGARLKDVLDWAAAQQFSIKRLYRELMAYAEKDSPQVLAVPAVIILGDEDIQTPTMLARAYFDRLKSPGKAFIVIPGGGHSAVFAMPDAFHEALTTHVRPLACPATKSGAQA